MPKRIQNDAFILGFNVWRRALERDRGFDKHAKSIFHVQATSNYEEYKRRLQSSSNVLDLLNKSRMEQINQNRAKLIKICSTVLLCARQMISLRGHEESLQ